MLLENPFFVREIRALGRREFAVVCRWLLLQCLFLGAAVLLLEGHPWDVGPYARRPLGLGAMCLVHYFACVSVGSALGQRLLLAEHQKRTLEGVLLISRSPWVWVPLKLMFPAALLGLFWLAAAPFYAVVAVRGHALPHELLACALVSLLAGAAGMSNSLLVSPESWPGFPVERRRRPLARWLEEGLPATWVLLLLFWRLVGETLPEALGHRPAGARTMVLLGNAYPAEQVLHLQVAALVLAALATTWSTANPTSRLALVLGRGLPPAALGLMYGLLVAMQWARLPGWARLLWAVGLPAVWLWAHRPRGVRSSPVRREDSASEREILALQGRWDNAVFIRDLRALLRSENLGRGVIRNVLAFLAIPASLAGFTLVFGPPEPRPLEAVVLRTGYVSTVLGPIFLFTVPVLFALRVRRLWNAERTRETLGQLINAPLTETDMVKGRWAACALAMAPALLGALVCCGLGVITLLQQRPEGLPGYLLSLGFWIPYGVAIGAVAGDVPVPKPRGWHWLLIIPFVAGPWIALPLSLRAIFALDGWPDELPGVVLAAVILYPGLAWGTFQASRRNLEVLRLQEGKM